MVFRVLDPTTEKEPPAGKLAPRLDTLEGKTVGFISNGKEGTKGFFLHLDRMLREEYGVAKVVSRTKSNYSAPTSISSMKSKDGMPSSPASGIEAAVHRAVCTTQ